MPIFEYECRSCGHVYEVLTRAGQAAPKKCPKCGQPKLQRKFSVFSGGSSKPDSCSVQRG